VKPSKPWLARPPSYPSGRKVVILGMCSLRIAPESRAIRKSSLWCAAQWTLGGLIPNLQAGRNVGSSLSDKRGARGVRVHMQEELGHGRLR
jgi:hypothetical protein